MKGHVVGILRSEEAKYESLPVLFVYSSKIEQAYLYSIENVIAFVHKRRHATRKQSRFPSLSIIRHPPRMQQRFG